MVNLTAATSGTDADWVVKLIDVYPDQVAGDHAMGGYQLAIAMDIFRGRYRTSLAKAAPITANAALPYRFALPTTNHVFLPGHRIMVQVQSSWRSEEHTSELQSLMRISYAVFCLKKKTKNNN